jgi:pimeloyl-ACP methyl ester carboxylesterase
MDPSHLERSVSHAVNLIGQGKGHEGMHPCLTWGFLGTFISAQRWHSLAARGGSQDFFSSYLSVDELRSHFSVFDGFTGRVHIVLGEEDELVPGHVDRRLLAQNLRTTLPNDNDAVSVIAGANHWFSSQEAADTFGDLVVGDLAALEGFRFPTPITAVTYARF